MRVLHLHSDLQWGGVEQWLFHLCGHIDRSAFQMEFFAASVTPQWMCMIQSRGLRLIPSPRPRRVWQYVKTLRETLRGRTYDAVHCHFTDHGGVLLREAELAGVPLRIAHSHLDTAHMRAEAGLVAITYMQAQNYLVRKYATRGLAASNEAARSMFGDRWESDLRWQVVHCGIELQPFSRNIDRDAVRARLGLRCGEFVFGHIGRFTTQKNHSFLLEVTSRLAQRIEHARFVWVGDGPLRADFENQLARRGLRDRVIVLPKSENVPELLAGAMDAFLFPSLFEGLGLALVEAQAAGLRCFVSDAVPEEADVVSQLVTRLPINRGPAIWVEAIERTIHVPAAVGPRQALETVQQSGFNIGTNARRIEELYRGAC